MSRLRVLPFLLVAASAVAAPSAKAESAYDWSALRTKLASYVPSTVPGLTFQLTRGGETLVLEAFGNQTVDSVLPIASSTKMPSALAVLTLVDRGLLDVDRPIGEILAGRIDWPADKAAITTRMLLNHTSGLQGDAPCLGIQGGSTTLRDCAQEIARAPLGFPPGTMFAYGGGSFQVAGYVAEVLAGKSWNAFFAEAVGAPLGLTRFTYGETANPRVAGGASSDVGDYSRIERTFLDGGLWQGRRILSPGMVELMREDQKGSLPVVNSPGGSELPGYSFGWWHSDPALHPGSDGPELSDQGAFGCTPWVDLDLGYTAVLLIRDRTSTGTAIWNEIRPLLFEQLAKVAPPVPRPYVFLLPSSARAPGAGGAFYTTDLTLANTGSSDAAFSLKFQGHDVDGRNGTERAFSLAAGRSVTYGDLLGSVFGLDEGWGAVRIASSTPGLAVTAQTSTPAAGGGSFGQALPAFPGEELVRTGEVRSIVAVREDASFRTNLVLANATESPIDVEVVFVSESGATLGARRVSLPPLGMTQLTRVVRALGISGSVTGARLLLSTPSPGAAFAAYASVVDEATNDPRTLLPR